MSKQYGSKAFNAECKERKKLQEQTPYPLDSLKIQGIEAEGEFRWRDGGYKIYIPSLHLWFYSYDPVVDKSYRDPEHPFYENNGPDAETIERLKQAALDSARKGVKEHLRRAGGRRKQKVA